MAHIEPIGKPRGASERYQFFRNKETGQEWKASIELRNARTAMLAQADVETAPAEIMAVVTVSPIDGAGKALREGDKPIVIDSFVHTFTDDELAQADFDPEAKLLCIVAERVHVGEARLNGQQRVKDFVGRWGGKTKLKVKPILYEGEENGTFNNNAG